MSLYFGGLHACQDNVPYAFVYPGRERGKIKIYRTKSFYPSALSDR